MELFSIWVSLREVAKGISIVVLFFYLISGGLGRRCIDFSLSLV